VKRQSGTRVVERGGSVDGSELGEMNSKRGAFDEEELILVSVPIIVCILIFLFIRYRLSSFGMRTFRRMVSILMNTGF
jgi:hypothetical protein